MRAITGSSLKSISLSSQSIAVPNFESSTPVREGLPSTYRMRAESHYVDLLDAKTSDNRDRANPSDAPTPVALVEPDDPVTHNARSLLDRPTPSTAPSTTPSITSSRTATATPTAAPRDAAAVTLSTSDPTLHAGRDLTQALATLSACAALLNGAPSDLSRAVVGNLIRAEAWRASALLHATRVVRQELPVAHTALSILGLLDQVVQSFLPERRVRSVTIDSQSDVAHGSMMAGDERLLAGALSSAVLATLALLDGIPQARVVVSASAEGRRITFAVTQDQMTPPPSWRARAFDAQWTDRTGGVPALVAMLAVQETARVHGGTALVATTGRGTRIAFTVPYGV